MMTSRRPSKWTVGETDQQSEPDKEIKTSNRKRKEPCSKVESPEIKRSVRKGPLVTNGCRSSDLYEKLDKIGEGTYGAVFKGRCRETNEIVALKKYKLRNESDGFPITSIRETITLLKGKHPNVIDVREIVFGDKLDQIYIVLEYMDRDLRSLMEDMTRPFKTAEIKLLLHQLLSAVAHLHDNWILHRDLKTSNLLINKGVLKVGDFGLAREYGDPLKQFTSKVVTLWYRAPELLLQTGKYSTPIDIWAVGCILGELVMMRPMFQGQTEIQQIQLIFQILGSPNEDSWPDYERIRLANRFRVTFPHHSCNRILEIIGDRKLTLGDTGLDLWNRLLAYDPGIDQKSEPDGSYKRTPTHRISANEALEHEFFKQEPRQLHPSLFPTWPSSRTK